VDEAAGPARRASHGAATSETGILPPTELVLGALFYRKVFDRAESRNYTKKDGSIHVAMLHRLIRRLSDALNSKEMLFDPMVIFEKPWVKWEDMRRELEGIESEMRIKVPRHPMERVNSVMVGESDGETGGSYLGFCWQLFSFVLIMTSIAAIMSENLQGYDLQKMIVVIFTFDYLVKLICSPFVRVALANIDVLVERVVPDSESGMLLNPEECIPEHRVWRFITGPMNMVDLASILPFWVDVMGAGSGLKLGFLRILRILRVVRLLKAGNFSETLQVLGETIRRSINSFVVMIIWILIIATLVGTVLNMLEEGHGPKECPPEDDPDGPMEYACRWTFDGVSTSVYWVIGRLCNMHGSLLAGGQIPKEDLSFALVLFLGICKGCCLVVPIGQIAQAFRDANAEFQRAKGITLQIFYESQLPLGTEWIKDRQSPFVEVDVMSAESPEAIGVASFNVPVNRSSELSATMDVPIDSKVMQRIFSSVSPYIRVKVAWEPHNDFKSGKVACARGTLTLTLLGGAGFSGSPNQQWRVMFRVPVGLHGEGAMQEWTTEPSSGGAPQPTWNSAAKGRSFEIKWIEHPERSSRAKDAYKLDDLLADMKTREERIAVLGHVLDKM
jgi:hypothetical protein